ncbi:MAG: hypothetical protein K2J95_06755 [Lachnospiraceae bacterium]|nr:hypothetical protein [Lachnospiraceae bacterium]
MFVEMVCQVCTCFRLPPNGRFTVGRQYSYEYLIDAERVIDDSGEMITFSENMFQSCFEHFEEAVTSYSPMLEDRTTYCVYLVIGGLPPALEEIKAYVKTMQVNYLQAKKALVQGPNLIFSGNAYHTGVILKKLSDFQVHYEIEPTYPYDF